MMVSQMPEKKATVPCSSEILQPNKVISKKLTSFIFPDTINGIDTTAPISIPHTFNSISKTYFSDTSFFFCIGAVTISIFHLECLSKFITVVSKELLSSTGISGNANS